MSLSAIPFLFLTHLGVGVALVIVLVPRQAGVKFFRFNAGLAAILIGAGLALRPGDLFNGKLASLGVVAILGAEAALVVYWATIGRTLAPLRPALVLITIGGGMITLAAQALAVAAETSWLVQALTVASFITSTALLGSSCGAMILGHWYLVLPSMDVSYLQVVVKFRIWALAARIVVVFAAVHWAAAAWPPGLGPSFTRYVMSAGGVFFWQRVLFGLAAPAVLSYLTWETAKIRSTQSATGILYVDVFTVMVGEVLAKYLLLATSVPV